MASVSHIIIIIIIIIILIVGRQYTVHYSVSIVEKHCVSVYVRDDNVSERDRWAL